MLGLLAGFRGSTTRASWARPAQRDPEVAALDVVGRRRLWFILSLVAIGVSIVALARPGPEPRHRLQGRRAGHVHDAEGRSRSRPCATRPPRSATATRSSRAAAARPAATSYKSFQIRLKKLTPAEQEQADEHAREQRRTPGKLGVKNVSSSFSRQILRGRDHRDHRLVRADRALRDAPLPVAVRGPDPAHAGQRRADHARRLRDLGPRGDRVDGRGGADDPRLLDLRHDHRLRPRAREHAADAARERSRRSPTSRSGRCCGGRSSRR